MKILYIISIIFVNNLISPYLIAAQSTNDTDETTTTATTTTTTSTSTITPSATTTIVSTSTTDTSNNNNSSSTTNDDTTRVCAKAGLTCLDCETLQYCTNANDAQPLYTVTCAVQTSNQNPYCSQQLNQCVNRNTCLQTQVPLLSCTQPGRHPDPNDCTQYIQCTRQPNGTLIGYPVKCSDHLKYNQRTQSCGSYSCLEMSKYCVFKAGKIVAYQPYPNIYGKCPDNGATNNVNMPIAMCPGQYTFNERTGQCEPKCMQVGNIPSNEDCHAYYSCGQGFLTGYSIVLNNCPSGFGYNPATQLCDEQFNNCTNIAN